MSYILDALRKADSERESGAVPNLHAQQYITMPADDEPRRLNGWLIALAGVLGAALVGVLAWALLGRDATRNAPTVASVSTAAPSLTAASTIAPLPPSMAASTALAVATATAPTPIVAPRRKPVAMPAPKAEPGSLSTSSSPSPSPSPPSPPTRSAATVRATEGSEPNPSRIYQTAELPESVRRELPAITVNGSSYSSDASSRLLIANGQVLHEGDKIGNGAQLEKIRQRSAVLSFKGYRYEITY